MACNKRSFNSNKKSLHDHDCSSNEGWFDFYETSRSLSSNIDDAKTIYDVWMEFDEHLLQYFGLHSMLYKFKKYGSVESSSKTVEIKSGDEVFKAKGRSLLNFKILPPKFFNQNDSKCIANISINYNRSNNTEKNAILSMLLYHYTLKSPTSNISLHNKNDDTRLITLSRILQSDFGFHSSDIFPSSSSNDDRLNVWKKYVGLIMSTIKHGYNYFDCLRSPDARIEKNTSSIDVFIDEDGIAILTCKSPRFDFWVIHSSRLVMKPNKIVNIMEISNNIWKKWSEKNTSIKMIESNVFLFATIDLFIKSNYNAMCSSIRKKICYGQIRNDKQKNARAKPKSIICTNTYFEDQIEKTISLLKHFWSTKLSDNVLAETIKNYVNDISLTDDSEEMVKYIYINSVVLDPTWFMTRFCMIETISKWFYFLNTRYPSKTYLKKLFQNLCIFASI